MNRSKWIAPIVGILAIAGLSSCSSDASKASHNVSVAADNFEVNRLIVGINGITDKILFSVEGRCSISRDGDLVVICKEGPDQFKKHYMGLSHNVTFISTQLEPVTASVYHTRIILKPENMVPNFDLSTGKQ